MIQTLKQVGYSLVEIRQNLDDPGINPLEIIQRQISVLRERARQATQPHLVLAMREEMQSGAAVDAREVRALVSRWQQLFRDSYCGADDALGARVRTAIAREPDLNMGIGVDAELMSYVRSALQAGA